MIANDLRKGTAILHSDGKIYTIVDFFHSKPGKGGAFVRVKMRCLDDGKISEHTFRAQESVERAFLERRKMNYLYRDGEMYVFMDPADYDQIELGRDLVREMLDYLIENITCEVVFHKGKVIGVELPETVILEVTEADPGEKGDTASGGSKPATLETGVVVKVPLFVRVGDRVKVDTRTGAYVERVQE